MADITYWSFDPDGDPTYKKTYVDRLIQIKSQLTHSTKQYSPRYGGISCSATMAEGLNCVRFKMNDYTKHPKRWKKVIIPCTDEQEDLMFAFDCRMANVKCKGSISSPRIWLNDAMDYKGIIDSYTYCGPKAIKYDKIGVVLCNISHRRIIKSWKNRVWCTEQCIMTLLQAFPDLTDKHPDEFRPDNGHKLIESLFVGVNKRA